MFATKINSKWRNVDYLHLRGEVSEVSFILVANIDLSISDFPDDDDSEDSQ